MLVGPSLNLETVARVTVELFRQAIDQSDGLAVPDRKIPVEGLVISDAPGGGKEVQVTYKTGHTQVVPLGRTVSERVAAGSSANLATALAQMGAQAIGIIGAVGKGGDSQTLVRSLERLGFTNMVLLRREGGTAESLFLKTPDGRTIAFSRKPHYDVADVLLDYFRLRTTARVIACTGFLPFELPLVETLLNTDKPPEARILSPHRGCFSTTGDRKKILDLAAHADFFHINAEEARELLCLESGWEDAEDSEVIQILRKIPSGIVCVTLDSKGSITYCKKANGHRLIRQSGVAANKVNSPIGAGDVHLAALIWYLWLRQRRIELEAALEAAAWIAARKLEFEGEAPRPADGIPSSEERKAIVHAAEERIHKEHGRNDDAGK